MQEKRHAMFPRDPSPNTMGEHESSCISDTHVARVTDRLQYPIKENTVTHLNDSPSYVNVSSLTGLVEQIQSSHTREPAAR
ncbi:hypothetical protein Bpfe_030481 [Biomphalaria pfeifferi]|uniref:Uncharacterized protein n=1 Tax=Biomphalaria pfeifferi TaxID=112525 RepID=A0AAD8EUP5_BIOPF|nr:hypothetical protein Bpfe_030481 [Biomphalaria pfeifferi]